MYHKTILLISHNIVQRIHSSLCSEYKTTYFAVGDFFICSKTINLFIT